MNKKIALINHGCAKNLVDSELMLGLLAEKGYEVTLDDNDADIVIVNTCSFIHDAEQESVQSILQMINDGKKVIVTGCLPQKHKNELKEAIPEICAMIGTSDLKEIVSIVERVMNENEQEYIAKISEKPEYIYPESVKRQQITMGASSYIKVADGCNYHCGYCIIPQLRGAYHSRTIENIVEEAKALVEKGVTEIVLIAQDTTSYGIDIYGKTSLAKLLEELNKIEGLGWIRIMYAYPSQMNDELINAIAKLDKVVKYIDIPLQHYDAQILEAMRRPVFDYEVLIKKLRDRIPGVAIRTAFIVGYPGETDEQFNKLYEFVKRARFDKMGVFEYSREKNTTSYSMQHQVPKKLKHKRYKELMALQQQISYEINQGYTGKTIPCIVEGITDDGVVIMRSQHDAPEIDGLVYAKSERPVVPGDIENVLIERADEYDLFGVIQ
ncbi:TPA: 30S ribosomal protein S12 methylthiotransferase RimO [Candidatus Scatousia excrementigallinarum]|uniref:Ribosomal protein uS12 methylthiotransferase RimO n=1 Tax=Candidatus Scatousia excrementigallinarum TaxID=2840935 RepID=A0A9D1EX37_9BACT|nr:30S ribosomal protein S12 methylthiotransferase RimO [Candidatus Scatousia excrementigallinarum]